MLVNVGIRNVVVIEALDLELGPGLTVITGETGAGKSVIVDALALALGARGGVDLVRAGAELAEVELLFDLSGLPAARSRVLEAVGDADDELVLRRTVRIGGRSRLLIDGRLATAVQAQRATAGLVDICSQHEHHALSDPASHAGFLDLFADLGSARDRMSEAHATWVQASKEVEALAQSWREREERLAWLRFQRDEILAVGPHEGEEAVLESERARLSHASRLAEVSRVAEQLVGSGEPAATTLVSRAVAALEGTRGLDPALDAFLASLAETGSALDDLARELGRYTRSVVHDPQRLAAIDDRLAALRRLARRHGGSVSQAVARLAAVEAEIAGFEDAEGRLEELERKRSAAAEAAVNAARVLSEGRQAAARELAESITRELADLGMGEARVEVEVARQEPRSGDLAFEGARVSPHGLDRVELLVAPHRGDPPKPLRRIASGGELSRALLAIKRVLAARGPRVLHVFDEVDTGVGGGVAESIGRKLLEVSRTSQVLCITHLPQIAVYGTRHLHVRKRVGADRNTADVTELSGEPRVEEIARMMGGLVVDDATRAAARALLAGAARGS